MCAIEYFSARTRKAYESVLMGWMNLQPIIQSEVSLHLNIILKNPITVEKGW